MKTRSKISGLIFALLLNYLATAQYEYHKWCYRLNGLDFTTTPPSVFSTTNSTGAAYSSISDAIGNFLFYTNGTTVWNQNYQVMANGTGLDGTSASSPGHQGCLIVRQPASQNIYYIFTCNDSDPISAGVGGIRYSVVDMGLAAGMGSVTVKNAPLWSAQYNGGKLTGALHCNGSDVWILTHERYNSEFHANLLTATGINTTAIVSVVGTTVCGLGNIKVSPNSKKLALVSTCISPGMNFGRISIHDFDNSTGIVSSNFFIFDSVTNNTSALEFSSDGTELYSTQGQAYCQWNLTAGSPQAVENSMQLSVGTTSVQWYGMQLGPDGKIYMSSQVSFGVINKPNIHGAGSSFSVGGQYSGPNSSSAVILNVPSGFYKRVYTPFSSTLNCQYVQFNGALPLQAAMATAAGNSQISSNWDFGDPASGVSNTATTSNPSHFYNALGNYQARLILHFPCYTDTVKQDLVITSLSPTLAVSGQSIICKGQTATLSASGTNSHSWSGVAGASLASVAVSPSITTPYTVIGTNTVNGCTASKTYTLAVDKCSGLSEDVSDEEVFKLYPNPNDGNFVVETAPGATQILVYNQLGELVYESLSDKDKQSINISRFAKGIYFVELHNEKTKRVIKLVKTE